MHQIQSWQRQQTRAFSESMALQAIKTIPPRDPFKLSLNHIETVSGGAVFLPAGDNGPVVYCLEPWAM